uniref:Orf136 protein n=1 Tax=Dunaliella viridis TaxID=140095 RepID=A0A0C5BWJ4_9CHLO|nr:LAGLIDADG endonuclease [Dunaliella viridis]AJN90455.1 LAGLIDADG endonuclease [Dunaliella viridis]
MYGYCLGGTLNRSSLRRQLQGLYYFTNTSFSDEAFIQWLVGFTDGDGGFSFGSYNGVFTFDFKIGQSTYNKQVLSLIKEALGYDSITTADAKGDLLQYRIREHSVLINLIIPIFDSYPLFSTWAYAYNLFKEALRL